MDVPRPATPRDKLADWTETDATVEEAFSTAVVSVATHTVVYEEQRTREAIAATTGVDHPWQFFFLSRIQLEPAKQPSALLTPLIRRQAAAGFRDRIADRGFQQLSEQSRESKPVGSADGLWISYRGVYRGQFDTAGDSDDNQPEHQSTNSQPQLALPVAACVAIWHNGETYYVAGGGYPADTPDSGPTTLVETLTEHLDPPTHRETLQTLIDSCGPT